MNKFLNWLFTSKSSLIKMNEYYKTLNKQNEEILKMDIDIIKGLRTQIELLEEMNKGSEKIIEVSNIIIKNDKETISHQKRVIEELKIINLDNLDEIDRLKLNL